MNNTVEQIRAEIEKSGAIPFARFMELALYCPLCGYYEKKEDTPGKRGDFYTSVSVGPLFGELLAFQFATWLEAVTSRTPAEFKLIEAGAHDGRLAADILDWLQRQRPKLFARVEYRILEPSPQRQAWQQETLQHFTGRVNWFDKLPPGSSSSNCIIFSNELLDAFPVHRIGWDAKDANWFEWGVALEDDRFGWARLPLPASVSAPLVSPEILTALPDGFTTETCPGAEAWWCETATWLRHGKLLTFDYGLSAEEFFSPHRANGTLRAYRQHQLTDDLLANPGEQDLTAHVNFTAIQAAGEAAGLKHESLVSQAQFLTGVAKNVWAENSGFGEWTREHTRQFQTLTHPQHLGRAFRVLVQSRGEPSS